LTEWRHNNRPAVPPASLPASFDETTSVVKTSRFARCRL